MCNLSHQILSHMEHTSESNLPIVCTFVLIYMYIYFIHTYKMILIASHALVKVKTKKRIVFSIITLTELELGQVIKTILYKQTVCKTAKKYLISTCTLNNQSQTEV